MKIWIIKEGEPLPIDNSPRLMRAGLLSEYLDKLGHEVTWFSSTYSHGKKIYRFKKNTELNIFTKSKLMLIHSPIRYKKNTSILRLIYSLILSKKFEIISLKLPKPDVILSSFPTLDYSLSAIKIGKLLSVPVIIDVRDLWPDIFLRIFPKFLHSIISLPLRYLKIKSRFIFEHANGITAVVPSHLNWAINKLKSNVLVEKKVIHIGYKNYPLKEGSEFFLDLEKKYQDKGISKFTWNICFFGTLSRMTLDLDTVILSFKQLVKDFPNLRLIISGTGDGSKYYKDISKDCSKIFFTDWIDRTEIQFVMKISKLAIYPFHNLPDFRDSLTNKLIEYMYGSLPIISSLIGYSKHYIIKNKIGLIYKEKSIKSFKQSLLKIYNDETLRQSLSFNSRKSYDTDFNSDSINKDFLIFIQNVLLKYKEKLNNGKKYN